MLDKCEQQTGLVIGFDFGMKRIGLAVGQLLTATATPLPAIKARDGIPDWQQLTCIIQQWQPKILVVGVPVHMDGSEQELTFAAKRFMQRLKQHYQLPIYAMDERLTTEDARARLYARGGYKALQKGKIDSLAAQLILSDWLQYESTRGQSD
jgi:putative Holliday junction resolvase